MPYPLNSMVDFLDRGHRSLGDATMCAVALTTMNLHPRTLHRAVAAIEMATWSLLIIGMILKYSGLTPAMVPVAGSIHGFGFLCFVLITTALWINNRWPATWGILGLVSSAIPFAAWPLTVALDRKGLLEEDWRRDHPRGPFDRVLQSILARPVLSLMGALILVAVVFATLLYLGPPVDVESVIAD